MVSEAPPAYVELYRSDRVTRSASRDNLLEKTANQSVRNHQLELALASTTSNLKMAKDSLDEEKAACQQAVADKNRAEDGLVAQEVHHDAEIERLGNLLEFTLSFQYTLHSVERCQLRAENRRFYGDMISLERKSLDQEARIRELEEAARAQATERQQVLTQFQLKSVECDQLRNNLAVSQGEITELRRSVAIAEESYAGLGEEVARLRAQEDSQAAALEQSIQRRIALP